MWKFQYFSLHCPGKNTISSKVFNEFSKTSFLLKDEERGYCARKFEMHRHCGFAIATLQLFQHPENVKISIFLFTLSWQKYHIFNSILTNFQKLLFCWKMTNVASARKFEMHRHFSFAIATLLLFQHPEHVKISAFPITLSQQKCYIFKSI